MKKIYFLFSFLAFAVAMNAQSVLIIHNGPTNNDRQIMNSIATVFDTMSIAIGDYTPDMEDDYDVVFITETPGSSGVTEIFSNFFDIPVVSIKAYLYKNTKTGFDPPWLISGSTFIATSASTDLGENADVPAVTETVILDSDYTQDFFVGVGAADDVFSFASANVEGGDNGGHFQVVDFEGSEIADIANAAVPLGESVWANDGNCVVEFTNGTVIMAALEANSTCEREAIFGIHSQYVLSDEMLTVINNAIYWVTETENPALAVSSVNNSQFNVYPNPMDAQLTVENAASINNVTIFDITGKAVVTVANNGINTMNINTTDLVEGVYMISLETNNGEIYTQKLVK